MRVNGISLGPIEIAIVAVAIAFLFSLMGKRRSCSKSGASKVFGFIFVFVMIFMAAGALFTVRTANVEQGAAVEHSGYAWEEEAEWRNGEPFEGPMSPMPALLPATDDFARQFGRHLVDCQAVFLPPDAEGNTQVMVSLDLDPEWRVFALGRPHRRARIQTISQLVLAESREKYSLLDQPRPEQDPITENALRYHDKHVIWTAPIKLREGIDPEYLTIHGTVQAQLMKAGDRVVVPVDQRFVARLDKSGAFAQLLSNSSSNSNSNSNHDANQSQNAVSAQSQNGSAAASTSIVQNDNPPQPADHPQDAPAPSEPAGSEPTSRPQPVSKSAYEEYPYGDPAYTDDIEPGQPAESWIRHASEVSIPESGAFYATVTTDPFHKERDPEMMAQFREMVVERINSYIDNHLLEPGASRRLNLQYPAVRDAISTYYTEAGDVEIDESGEDMVTMYGRVALTPEFNSKIKEMYRDSVIIHRVTFFGALAAMALAFVGAIYGYFRLDTATKGYYSGWLKTATFVVCLLILAAGSGILEEFGRRGF